MSKVKVDYAVVYCPSAREMLNPEWVPPDEWAKIVKDRLRPPPLWDPDLARHLHHLNSQGRVAFFDWRYLRMRSDALAADLDQYDVGELILWGSVDCYTKMKELASRLKQEFTVMGEEAVLDEMSKRLPGCKGWAETSKDPMPHLDLFELEGYWRGSWLPHNMDTVMWKRRIPLNFSMLKTLPKSAARVVRTAKLRYCFDSVSFTNWCEEEWTLRMLRHLEDDECRFGFTIMASFNRLDAALISRLREHGCRVIDLGVNYVVNLMNEPGAWERLQGAVMALEKLNVSPAIQLGLSGAETSEDLVKATEFMVAHNLLHRPKLFEVYRGKPEEEWIQLNTSFVNPFKGFTDSELLGVLHLMETGDLKRLREV